MFDLKFSFFAIGEKGHNLQTHVSFLAVRFKTAEKILSRQQPVCQKEDSASSRGNNDLPIRGTGADFQFSIFIKKSKHRCINFYINKFQIPSPTLRGVAKRPLILADMTFLTRLRSSEIPPLIVLAA